MGITVQTFRVRIVFGRVRIRVRIDSLISMDYAVKTWPYVQDFGTWCSAFCSLHVDVTIYDTLNALHVCHSFHWQVPLVVLRRFRCHVIKETVVEPWRNRYRMRANSNTRSVRWVTGSVPVSKVRVKVCVKPGYSSATHGCGTHPWCIVLSRKWWAYERWPLVRIRSSPFRFLCRNQIILSVTEAPGCK